MRVKRNAINNYARTDINQDLSSTNCNIWSLYLQPTYGPPLATLILSQGSTLNTQKIHSLSCPLLPLTQKETKRTTALFKFGNTYLPKSPSKVYQLFDERSYGMQERMVKSYQKQNFSSLITYQTKKNKIKRIDKSKHTRLFETSRFNYFGTRALCQK